MSAIVDVENLSVSKAGAVICAVEKLTVQVGERIGVLGENGSGKSTLLRVLAGLETEFAGCCEVDEAAKQRVFVHQSPMLFRGTSLINTLYGLRSRGQRKREAITTAMGWLERLGVHDHAAADVETLSGGERKRVAWQERSRFSQRFYCWMSRLRILMRGGLGWSVMRCRV